MGCASAATAGGGVCGGSDGGGIDRTDKPSVETFTTAGGLDRASATTLAVPGVCLRSVVNSYTKARWRCWRADCGGVTRVMEATRGLWSVMSMNCRKCLLVMNAARSSLSNVEYLTSAGDNFVE